MIYWADRREGIFRTSIDTRNRKFSLDEFDYFVRNNWLGYYGTGITWGNTNGPFIKYKDTYWWAKNTTGSGIFRFKEGDINPGAVPENEPAAGEFFASIDETVRRIRGMVIDEVNEQIFVAVQDAKYILQYDLNTGERTAIDLPRTDDSDEGDSESLFVTDFALDVDENGDGYVYWAYRNTPGEEPATGIKRYKLNDPGAEPEYYLEGVEAYGLAIDNTLR